MDGLLYSSEGPQATDNVRDEIPNCELVFEANVHEEDYHRSMNGKLFMLWLNNRLIPSFKRKYGDKKMILILDNASFHHHRGDDFISVSGKRKDELIEILSKLGVDHVDVMRKDQLVRFEKKSWSAHGGQHAPTSLEIKTRIEEELMRRPELRKTEVQKLFGSHGYKLVYTPPYCPSTQPIEVVWSHVKRYVASKYEKGRNPTLLRKHLQLGFYGDGTHKGVTREIVNGILKRVHEYCNSVISSDEYLEGTIDNLSQVTSPPANVSLDEEILEEMTNDDEDWVAEEY